MSMPLAIDRQDNSSNAAASSTQEPVEITICLGSSCFARGNSRNLALLEQYARKPGSNLSIRLIGNLCQEQCSEGPNVKIGGTMYHHVTAEQLSEMLRQLGGQDHATA